MNIIKPIGLENVCVKIEEICANPYPYKIVKPPHFAVALDAGNGRTTLLEYISDMLKSSGIIDFTGGVDDFLEVTLDGSLAQLCLSVNAVNDAAFYNNGSYSGVIGIDVTRISAHQNETQAGELESFIENIAESAIVVLFASTNLTASEEKFLTKIKNKFTDIIDFGECVYTAQNYADITLRYVEDLGVDFDKSEAAFNALLHIVENFEIDSVSKTIKLGKELVLNADYSAGEAVITKKQISKYYSTRLNGRSK